MQKNSGNSSQSELKIPGRSEKTFCGTSITHILQSIRSNFTKFLSHVIIQVSYKILRLESKKRINHFVVNALELAVLSGFWRKNAKEL